MKYQASMYKLMQSGTEICYCLSLSLSLYFYMIDRERKIDAPSKDAYVLLKINKMNMHLEHA